MTLVPFEFPFLKLVRYDKEIYKKSWCTCRIVVLCRWRRSLVRSLQSSARCPLRHQIEHFSPFFNGKALGRKIIFARCERWLAVSPNKLKKIAIFHDPNVCWLTTLSSVKALIMRCGCETESDLFPLNVICILAPTMWQEIYAGSNFCFLSQRSSKISSRK